MTLFPESSDSGCSQHSTRDKTSANQQNTCDVQGYQAEQQLQNHSSSDRDFVPTAWEENQQMQQQQQQYLMNQQQQNLSSNTATAISIQDQQRLELRSNTTATENQEEKQKSYLTQKRLEEQQVEVEPLHQKQAGHTIGVDGKRLEETTKHVTFLCSFTHDEEKLPLDEILTNHPATMMTPDCRARQEEDSDTNQTRGDDTLEPQVTIKQDVIVCSPTDDDEIVHDVTQHTDHPVDDFIAVKTPDFLIRHDQVEELEESNRGGTLTSESHQPIDTVAVQEYQGLIIAVHPLKNESDSTETCRELVPAKKEFDGVNPNYNDDEYLRIVRGITSVPHDFAPERVVTPVYTVPRYPDNHNPLLPLSLQKKLGKDIRPHWYYI